MVKSSQPRPGAFPPPPKRPRGRPETPELSRTDRLLMRSHPDLVSLVEMRAKERAMTRSKFIEQLLIGFLNSDPRNPKLTVGGKVEHPTIDPVEQRDADPHRFATRWARFSAAHQAIFGTTPPSDWDVETERFWRPEIDQGHVEDPETTAANAEATARIAKTTATRKK